MNAEASGTVSRTGCLPERDLKFMSYILDALKKIEHEKNKKKPDGRVSISGDLFKERMKPVASSGLWKIMLLIAVASVVTCAGTWFVLQGKNKKTSAQERHAAPPQPVAIQAPVAAPVIPVVIPATVATQPLPVAVKPAASSVVTPVRSKNSKISLDAAPSAQDVRRQKRPPTPQPVVLKQTPKYVPVPADIKLSGIAWQDERAGRRAVVNGFLLKEGAAVSGATITDIQADRVRFSSPAGLFEVKLDSALPNEVPR